MEPEVLAAEGKACIISGTAAELSRNQNTPVAPALRSVVQRALVMGEVVFPSPILFFLFFFFFFCLFRAAPATYGGSQARSQIGAATTGLCQIHSNLGSEPHLQPTPQLTAMPDP